MSAKITVPLLWKAAFVLGSLAGALSAQVSVLTSQGDNGRTGQNLSETTLTTSNVNTSQFGKLFTRSVDGYIYAQPLYVPNVSVSGQGIHNVVYVATMNNSVYAFDADNPNASTPLWQTSLGTPVPANTPYLPANETGGLAPTTGILATPVIDPASGTLYAVASVLLSGAPAYQLHALDITSGAEKAGSPVLIQGSVNGSGPDSVNGVITFNPAQELQRTGLLLSNGALYFGFASYHDIDPYHGWIFGYSATTLLPTAIINLAPGGRGGLWQSGGGFSVDSNGFIYACTGNGVWDGTVNFGESCVKLDPTQGLAVLDYFTPYNYSSLDATDADLGSGWPLLIPGTNLVVAGGKEQVLYVMNRNNLGHLSSGNDNLVQQFSTPGAVFNGLAYWNNPAGPMLYVWPNGSTLQAYQFSGGLFNTIPASTGSVSASYGTALTISSNGSKTGSTIVWAATPQSSATNSAVPGTVRAYDATNLTTELWDSDQNSARDALGNVAKFSGITVANGKVYVPTFSGQLAVYGLLPSAPVTIAPGSVTLGASQTQQFNANLPVTWSISPQTGAISTSGYYTAPVSVTSQQTITVTATSTANSSNTATATITLNPISVTVSPSTATLFASQTQLFSAQVTGSSNTSVTWSINPSGIGSISSGGLYTAPSSVATSQTVTVTATSVADNTKSGSAMVTLSPLAAPAISQQPNNIPVFSGQPATFSISATGGGLSYQWQSEPSGGSSFTNIAGAVGSSYTTPATSQTNNGTQFRCVVSNSQGSITSSLATLTVLPAGSPFVKTVTLGHLRNNFTGPVGMEVTVGNTALTVTSLGRIVAPGNTGIHTVKVVNASTGVDIPGASVSVATAGFAVGAFSYTALASPIVLSANTAYYVVSMESQNGDSWYDVDTAETTTQDGVLTGAAYNLGSGYALAVNSGGYSYVPVDFVYSGVSVAPGSVTLDASQTQQFSATVSGLPTSGVSWTISPQVGSISSSGLYTAPTLISSSQTIVLTATSTSNSGVTGTATINLIPVSVSVAPPTASLFQSQTQQFTSTVTGTTNTTVTWSINPSTAGSISSAGLYTAPASIATNQGVTVTATSASDGTKFGTATVTLNAPVAPAVTQQPQNAAILVGQTATFTVAATGGGLTYQWQSMATGAGAFSNITGANSASYTTPAAAQTNTGTQFRCVIANSAGSTNSNAATMTVVSPGAHFISSFVLGTLRNNFNGWVGMSFTMGPASQIVTSLGRMIAPGNTGTHIVKIVDASTGNDVPGGSVSINTTGASPGSFLYAALPSPITLNANGTYYVASQETQGGDSWYDLNTTAQTLSIATLNGPAYASPSPFSATAAPGTLYVPVDFSVQVSISVSPTSANLFDGQTQQFSATVLGGSSAIWSINPNVGTISSAGLYTAPNPITANQTITVKATSSTDITQFASASVTLNLPAAPAITQQPQTANVFAGQTATFSVTASGVGMSYQWQSLAPGAGSFTNISGATGSSYTTPAAQLTDSGTMFQCIITNRVGSVTSAVAALTVGNTGAPYITSVATGTLRNNFTGWVGMEVTVGATPIVVSSLGRFVLPGNSGAHTLKIVDGTNWTDVPGGSTSINTQGQTPGTFVYGLLPAPLTLSANYTYYILSSETQGSDQWFDSDTTAQPTADARLIGSVYGNGTTYSTSPQDFHTFGPLNFQYVSLIVTPGSAVLTTSETQQFTATTTNGTGLVTWSLSPQAGSISSTGLYTAPSTITATQTVTVTATAGGSATATVTLNPPATITQQPSNTTVFAGGVATLTIVATGPGLTYQWQSMPSGGTSFTSIAGALSATYTTPATALSDNGTQFRCIVTSTGLPVVSNAATLTVLGGGATFLTSTTLGTPRNDVTGWTGMSVTVGPIPLVVTALGRIVAPGNTATHTVKIVDAATGTDVPNSSVSVATANTQQGTFVYTALPNPITLTANHPYYILSQETQGGDEWYDKNTVVQTTADAVLSAAVQGPPYTSAPSSTNMPYGPLDFIYISIGITPTSASLQGSQTQQFSVTSSGLGTQSIDWTVSPAVGSVTSGGLYTAPAVIASQQTVTVTATPHLANIVSASASVTLIPVAVSLSPTSGMLQGGGTQQFTPTVTGSANTAVTWSINPSTTGSISSSGLYTAPGVITSAQTVTITATSAADPTKSASTTLNLIPVGVTVAPPTLTLLGAQTQQFTATVTGTGNSAVNWSISPSNSGSISSGGLYTAPSPITAVQTVTVTATSSADGTKSASATVTLTPNPPAITQQPANTSVYQGSTATFIVTATGIGLTYQWQSQASGAGTFTNIAGATSPSYTTAPTASTDNGTQFQCVITNPQGSVTSNPATLSVLPAGASFITSNTLGTLRNNFTGWVGMSVTTGPSPIIVRSLGRLVASGNSNPHTLKIVNATTGVDISGASVTINTAGITPGTFIYAAWTNPITLNPNTTYYILSQETQGGDQFYDSDTTVQTTTDASLVGSVYGAQAPYTAVASSTHTYGPVDFKYISVDVSPLSATLQGGQTQAFSATVSGLSGGVTWSLSPNIGTISSAGLYTAPNLISIQQTVTATATSVTDPTKSASALITLVPVAVTVSPTTANLFNSQTQQFNVTVTGTANTAITWTMNPTGAGSISNAGLYTAPSSIASSQTVTLTATSVVDTSKSASATVTLSPPTPPVISQQPLNTTAIVGQTATFSVTAQGLGTLTYQWQSMAPGAGSFTNISGANSNSYTTPQTVLTNNGTQFQCIVTNTLGSTTSSAAELTVAAPAIDFVTSSTLGGLQNDFTGWIGESITVGATPLLVNALGRIVVATDTQTHNMKIVDASTGNDIAGATTTVNPVGGTPGTFVYGLLQTPVTLNANSTYYILTNETKNGDNFYDPTTTVQTTNVATVNGPVYQTTSYNAIAEPGHLYGPLDFSYNVLVSISINPGSAILFPSQTQQFTANVVGNNPAVTWSISPAGTGSISSNGLYTAPATIVTSQTVTVTATSVVDPSKFATATVTVNPPGPPSITGQPQSIQVFVGQSATFTVAAVGPSLAYQWQSMAPGAGSFTNLSGATSASYSTPATTLAVNGTQFRCIITNPQGSVTSNSATLGVLAAGSSYITSKTLGTLRNNFGGWVGMSVTVGSQNLVINSLGHLAISGDTGTHTVKIVNAATSVDVPGSSVSINIAGGSAGTFVYQALPAPVTLAANTTYYFMSQETQGGDSFYDSNTTATTTTDGVLNAPIYSSDGVTYNSAGALPGHLYVPLDFRYAAQVGIGVNPATASLFASQTQQFAATVTGNSNTNVTWSVGPTSLGSVSSTGLYTAPANISAASADTVIATSVVDPSKTAVANVALAPVAVSVSPSSAILFASQAQAFTATVTGTTNSAVTWALSPAGIGSITSAGVYTAPSPINAQQPLVVTATSVADGTKFATASITLDPPAPPSITQQPVNANISTGQTGTFTIAAIGPNLTYQWQSLPLGASGFANITGANSTSYTTPVTTLADNGTQFRCVITNTLGSVSSNAATLAVSVPPVNFVTSATLGGLQNDFTGFVGMSITTGSSPVVVQALGRIVATGNTAAHLVKIVDSSNVDVPGASATVNTAGGTVGTFAYGSLANPVTLSANTTYYIMSQETKNGEFFYDTNTVVQTSNVATVNGIAYGAAAPYSTAANPGHTYGPLDFKYTPPVSVTLTPSTVILFGAQTQQFNATVNASANQNVTWSINPTTAGSISSSGLYTAPNTIATQSTVAVTATSVADVTKSATATVTLSPPSPPVFTQQPQNASVVTGQTATFTVTTTGLAVTYQWQSMPSGASSFTNIAGATSASYTTPAAALSDNATQFQCIATNAQGSVSSNAVTLTVLPPGTNFITSFTAGGTQNDYTGFVGMTVTVGNLPLVVTSLGRYVLPGNTGTHTVKIVDASTGLDIPNASTTLNLNAGTPGSFLYGALQNAVTLNANGAYYIVSSETQNGDAFYDSTTTALSTNVAALTGTVYGPAYVPVAAAGHVYGPVTFSYIVPISVSVAPPTASLFGSQTQQFTATVAGTSNTGVTWTINPTTAGSVSGSGLYTAPATIASQSTVTVTATSVADATRSGSATVTLNPPAPPSISQQPQNASAFAGQTVTFSVTAAGPGLVYQWQLQPSGSNVFGNISGAASNSYTIPPAMLTDNGSQFRCVISNTQGSVTSNAVTLTVLPAGSPFITSTTPGSLRNNYSGWVGMSITVGSQPIVVGSLGRLVAPGNTASHTVKIVNASTGLDVTGGSATVATTGGTSGAFAYGALASPVTLNANATYYIISQETSNGDQWYNDDTTVQTTTDAALNGPAYGTGNPYQLITGMAGHVFVPVNLVYTVSVSIGVAPTTVSLFASQTQQFTATVTGTSNTGVTWSLNPTTAGSISTGGLYTAPATIASQQTVTVTATSVADATKTASATVTLNPPAPPSITQQPQNATVNAGQTATFNVTAGGGGLSYQWQSMPPGGSVFGNVTGATSASYTTPATALTDSGTQFRCVVTNTQGSITSNAATVTVLPPGTPFLTSTNLGTARNNYSGWVGMTFTVGSQPILVSSLGRWVASGNSGTHLVKIVNAANSTDVASVSINTSGAASGTFLYSALSSPVLLSASTTYYLVSQETQGGDTWYDDNTTASSTTDAMLTSAVYGAGSSYTPISSAGTLYVPVNFKYSLSVAVTVSPTSAILYASGTQPFTASVIGNSNTSVTWSISPTTTGSISSTGVYTAPVTVATQQTVTVTATSVADPTKSASATVTLNPPAPPSISQQPQNGTAAVGQTATFSVTALGGGLTYQWQSMPSGAGSFSNISGATSSSYTTPPVALTDNGTQFQCVVTNSQGSITSSAATLTVLPAGTAFLSSVNLGSLRNNYSGWVGMSFTVGSQPIVVSSVARMVVSGNQQSHTVKLVVGSNFADVPGGSASISTVGATAGVFAYGALANPVTLNANTTYYLVSQETAAGDQWYDINTTASTTTDAVLNSGIYANSSVYAGTGNSSQLFVPVNFKYTLLVSVTVNPTAAVLFGSQTQQFTATVTGSNPAATWTINPPGIGTVSSTGLYTAPATISAQQTVTVTATSVADASKSASATVTLNPPAPPSFSQQPQNATTFVGQTATFSVAVLGVGVTYQWQSMPSGAGSFANISGATSNSYTTPAAALTDNGTQFRCVATNTQGSLPSSAATLTVLPQGTAFLTSTTLGALRNNFSGWVGMSFTVGSQPLLVSSLGRMVASGNTGTHTVKIVNGSTGLDVSGASVSINTTGATAGAFLYGALSAPVTLNANSTYYLMTQETSGGDSWYDSNSTVTTTTDASLAAAVWNQGSGYNVVPSTANHPYGPLDFKYTVPVSVGVSPTTASLFASQTQQFSSTVTGSSNTGVTWSINPLTLGSVSSAGLYTAPSTIASQQTVTVTATSVADGTKSASATVTLNPPAPPSISQQPQNATASAGQTATFSVTALGGSLTYQWQSMPSGAGSFANISGANASTYTTPVTSLSDNGTAFRCVVTNSQGSVTSNAATLTVQPPGSTFLTSSTLGTLRSDFSGWVGLGALINSQPLVVNALGRIVVSGNTQSHLVKIVTAAGADVPGASVTINTSGASAGKILYGSLTSPVTLSANTIYYVVSQETLGGDQWYNNDTVSQTTTDASLTASVWGIGSSFTAISATAGHPYGPVDFKYTIQVSVGLSPATVNLFASQTQQFTATVTGNSNTGVTWSINPTTVGSVSTTGLYTAPATISTQQTVTVTATSVVDPSKSANATVTLNPPAPPSFTQQPQNATVPAGQTASFSVTVLGSGVTFQWQSMPSGAGSFTNISGATANTYTTPAAALTDNGTQFRCVATNSQGSVTSNAATLTVLPPGTNFVTSATPGTLRNNFSGWVGMQITVGTQPLLVSALGRYVASGNVNAHTVKIVNAGTGLDVAGASTSVATAGVTAGGFAYSTLAAPVTLNAGSSYYILSAETQGADSWYDDNTLALTTPDASLVAAVYGTGSSYTAVPGTAGHPYVPLDFKYTQAVSVSVSPTSANLFPSQTQQFTATVSGSNPAVTWSINPPGTGTVSSAGLYTAPATISAQQTITVTATSQADMTKSASATVTLNPPAPPSFSQQPQNATTFVGQTASFSVTVLGVGVTYQWQSMPSGAGSFANISGATGSSYTTAAAALTDNGTQFRCIATNTQGSLPSAAATLTVLPQGTAFLTSTTLGALRNNFSGWVGMSFTVGSQPLLVSSLGRMVASGNTGTHTVKIVNGSTGLDVSGASVSINTTGATAGAFLYGALSSPVTLSANSTYYVMTQETSGGDSWYDSNTTVTTTSDASLAAAVWNQGSGYNVVPSTANHPYGPLDFKYTVPVSVAVSPTTAVLFPSQTQQFTSTVTGNSNTGVTWSINPSTLGSVSSSGLYTAPSTIASQQTVTVTAASVVDVTKSASATVTLNPLGPPLITQQPQNSTVVVGQTATFTVSAAGTGLSYQWQSKPSGGGSFANISGAIASSYTTPATAATDNGTQFQCVVTNAQGSTPSNAATLTVQAANTTFLTSATTGTARNDFSGWVGMNVTVGAQPLVVGSLGRFVTPGDSGTHIVKIVNAGTGIDVAGGSVTVATATDTVSTFDYVALASPITLSANTTYYIVSQEVSGGDAWYNMDTTVQTTTDAALTAPVWNAGSGYNLVSSSANHTYVPVDFKYAIIGH